MTKFGELISTEKPVLIDFYTVGNNLGDTVKTLRDVVAALGNKAKIIKIDITKNENLADALRVKEDSTFMIYKRGQMKWRETGSYDADTLINLVQEYV